MATVEIEVHEREKKAGWLHVKVVDTLKDGGPAVSVNMPIGVARFGLKMAQAFSPDVNGVKIDWDELTTLIESGEAGKLVEVDDEAQHKHVEVWVD